MRLLAIAAILVLGAAAIACDDSGSPAPTATPTPEHSALEIWARSMATLEQVNSVRVSQIRSRGAAPIVRVFPRGGEFTPGDALPWNQGPLPLFPSYTFAEPGAPSLTRMRTVDRKVIGGKPHWVIAFDGYQAGIDTVDYYGAEAWIDEKTYLISKIEYRITKSLGCCGSGLPPGPHVYEYSDYEFGPWSTPTPFPTDVPAGPPPDFSVEPLSGPCDGTVTVTVRNAAPGAEVSAYTTLSAVSVRGDIDGGELKEVRVGEDGTALATFRLAERWCTSPEAAVVREALIRVSVNDDIAYNSERFVYRIEPCDSPEPEAAQRYCLNEG